MLPMPVGRVVPHQASSRVEMIPKKGVRHPLCSAIRTIFRSLVLDILSDLGNPVQAVLAFLASPFVRRGAISSFEYLRHLTTLSSVTLLDTVHAVCRRSSAMAPPNSGH